MKRILILYEKNIFSMTDFWSIDYSKIPQVVDKDFMGIFPNVGNKVWLQAIVSLISSENVEYDFGYESISTDDINNNFDYVIMPLANCFHSGWIQWMRKRTQIIKQIKIPVFVIACGVQANSYDDLNSLIESTREPATEFIKSVYNTGGEWALRGFFTYEYFKRLGFPDAVVTGCPSLFQMGRDLLISNYKISQSEFKYSLNGGFDLPINDDEYDNCDFIDQGNYGNLFYDSTFFEKHNFNARRILKLVRRGETHVLKAIADNRIKIFADTQDWLSYFILNKISFSFGSRIHGTIMPILAQTPSMLYACDARTQEMAEFFDIPFITPNQQQKKSIYDWYVETDYSKFNKYFKKRFDDFQSFMVKCGLVDRVNENNIFMSRDNKVIKFFDSVNSESQEKLNRKIRIMKPAIWITKNIYNC